VSFSAGLTARLRRFRRTVAPSATYVIITITLLVFLLQLVSGGRVTDALQYAGAYSIPASGAFEPWRMLTVSLVHSTAGFPLHVLFNMLALWLMGQQLEVAIGRWRFVALYAIATLGGSVAVLYLTSPFQAVVGASGAIFGLLGAYFVLARKYGGNTVGIVVLIGINLAFGFFASSISWQAHVGGLITGIAVSFALVQTPKRTQRPVQVALLIGIVVVLILLTAVRSAFL
jgi:membrane associated rhomboid family serine protease